MSGPIERWTAATVLLGLAVLGGCSRDAAPDAFFPLEAGHRWTYRVATQWSDGKTEDDTLTLTTLGKEPLPAGAAAGDDRPAWRRHSADGVDHWLRADANGIRRVATRSLLDPVLKADSVQRFVLKAPYVVGTQWAAPTTAYVLERRFDFPREVRLSYPPVTMTYRIEATGDSVDTPVGHHTDCLRVRGTATIRVFADPVVGWRELPLASVEWYCRGIGLVRLERSEPPGSNFTAGGTRTLTLASFT